MEIKAAQKFEEISQGMIKEGDFLGGYRICRVLGSGGMGTVYEAVPQTGGKAVALKVFTSNGSHSDFLRKRFVAEGKILSRLNHPCLVKVYDLGFDDVVKAPYFTMGLVLASDGKPCTLAVIGRMGACIPCRNAR